MYWRAGEDIFVFTQVFAPTDLETQIDHEWEWYDQQNRRWETRDIISLPITGGRANGYRGFSKKKSLSYGKWRVKTSTNGKTLGILFFDIEPYGSTIRELITEEL